MGGVQNYFTSIICHLFFGLLVYQEETYILYVCVYISISIYNMYVWVCLYAQTYVRAHFHTQPHVHTDPHSDIHTCTHMLAYTHTHVTHTCTHSHTHTCTHSPAYRLSVLLLHETMILTFSLSWIGQMPNNSKIMMITMGLVIQYNCYFGGAPGMIQISGLIFYTPFTKLYLFLLPPSFFLLLFFISLSFVFFLFIFSSLRSFTWVLPHCKTSTQSWPNKPFPLYFLPHNHTIS